MNTPVSFPLAKLVIQKGFDKECKEYWNLIEYSSEWIVEHRINPDSVDFMYAPTIAEVVMWLYEKRGIWITINMMTLNGVIKFWCQYFKIQKLPQSKNNFFIELPREIEGNFNSPTEAYEAAIDYTLNNLI